MARFGMSGNDALAGLVASRIRRVSPSRDSMTELTWPCLLIRIGDRWCALRAESVREVITPDSITRVPTQPEHVLGVTLVHGRLVPAIDLGPLMTGIECQLDKPPGRRLAVVANDDLEIGLVADDAKGVIELPAITESQQGADRPDFVVGEVRWQKHLVCLLDADVLLRTALGAD